jgi:hypothetical protein
MYRRHLPSSFFVLVVAAALSFGVAAPAMAASRQYAAPVAAGQIAARALPAASISSKVTLPETSIDGPALTSVGTTSVIGWTGIDAAHHLNLEISYDGLHFAPDTKLTLNETSPFRPDVTFKENSVVSIAWMGSDANHSLNVVYGAYQDYQRFGEKLTLRTDNSFTAPAILAGPSGVGGSTLYLAWTGTDANHSLNFLPVTEHGGSFTLGTHQILSQYSSNAAPHLVPAGPNSIALCWTSRSGHPMAAVAGGDLKFGLVATLGEQTSAYGPGALFRDSGDWISWTGMDAAHHLNVVETKSYPTFPNPKTVLPELALGGPALAFNNGNQIAWTGTDAQHHLNIAKFG